MVVYGEGRYRCPVDGIVVPQPRTADAIAAGRFDPPCPRCGADLAPEPVPEDAPMDPRSVYAATKLHQEHLCFLFGRNHDLPVTALRYHNIYGPRMPANTPYAGVASIFLSALAAGRAPHVLEDGRQLRDFVHVDDVARANLLALTTATPYDGPLNIASGNPQTVGELARRLWLATGAATPPAVAVGGSRAGDVRHVFASAARRDHAPGFRGRSSVRAGHRTAHVGTNAPADRRHVKRGRPHRSSLGSRARAARNRVTFDETGSILSSWPRAP